MKEEKQEIYAWRKEKKNEKLDKSQKTSQRISNERKRIERKARKKWLIKDEVKEIRKRIERF